jgi:hypothetical protein
VSGKTLFSGAIMLFALIWTAGIILAGVIGTIIESAK